MNIVWVILKKLIFPHSDAAARQRLLLALLAILGAFLLVAGTWIVSQQRHLLLEDEKKRATLELELIGEFISESFLKRDYAAVDQFLTDWSQKRPYVVTLEARLQNGFALTAYERQEPAARAFPLERQLGFANGNSLDFLMITDLAKVERVIWQLNAQLLAGFAAVMVVLGVSLWWALHRLALKPMQQEIYQQAEALGTTQAENLRMGAELEITRRLQIMLLPNHQELAAIQELDIACFMEPASEIGGDYYDVLHDPHEQRIKIGIGDVTGHGLESGVLMLMVQMAVRTLLASGIHDPKAFFSVLNRAVFDNVQRMRSDRNLTLLLLDYMHGKVQLSGQHEEVLLVRKNGQVQRIDTLDLGFMVGLEPDISHFVAHQELELHPGDGIVLYTDGITEARNTRKQLYGVERLCEIVSRHWHEPAQAVQAAVLADLARHVNGQRAFDDVTLVVFKRREVPTQDS